MPVSAVAGSSTSPPSAVTRMTTLGSPVSKICSSAAAACADSASGSSNPPPVSSWATPPPSHPAMPTNTSVVAKTHHRRGTKMSPSLPNISVPFSLNRR